MLTCFTACDIFDIAEEIERNAAGFYREAAKRCPEEDTKKIFLDIATAEDGHVKIFQRIRKEFDDQENMVSSSPDERSAMYLQIIADARGWEGRVNPLRELSGKETPKEIIETALNSEKESVVFYSGLKSLVSTEVGKKRVDEIIIEELGHISAFLKKLKSLG